MQVRYGCGDNYRAFNGNLGVSFSDVNRDVKSGSQFRTPPVAVLHGWFRPEKALVLFFGVGAGSPFQFLPS